MIYFHKKYIFYGVFAFLLLILKLVYILEPSHLWDEATYALIAQEILNGSLPYVHYWDNKAPLLFAIIAFWFMLFGSNVISYFALAGCFLLGNSLYLRSILQKTIYFKYGNLAAILLLLASCSGLSGIYSEYFIVIPLLYSINFFVFTDVNKHAPYKFFLLGILLSIAVLIRANLWLYPLLCLLIIYLNKNEIHQIWNKILLFILGGISVLFIILLPYIISNKLSSFVDFVKAALLFSSPKNFFSSIGYLIMGELSGENSILYLVVSVMGGWFLYLKRFAIKILFNKKRINFLILFLGALISVLSIGVYYHHYAVHFIVFVIILFIFLLYNSQEKTKKIAITVVLIAAIVPITNSVTFFSKITNTYFKTGTFWSDPAYQMQKLIAQQCTDDCSIFANNHILLFLLQHKPNHFLVHPSNLSDGRFSHYFFATTPINVNKDLFSAKPRYISYSELNAPFERDLESEKFFYKILEKNYQLIKKIGHSKLYERTSTAKISQ